MKTPYFDYVLNCRLWLLSFSLLLEVLEAQLSAITIFHSLDPTPDITHLENFEFWVRNWNTFAISGNTRPFLSELGHSLVPYSTGGIDILVSSVGHMLINPVKLSTLETNCETPLSFLHLRTSILLCDCCFVKRMHSLSFPIAR
jgi:hypothetical protein